MRVCVCRGGLQAIAFEKDRTDNVQSIRLRFCIETYFGPELCSCRPDLTFGRYLMLWGNRVDLENPPADVCIYPEDLDAQGRVSGIYWEEANDSSESLRFVPAGFRVSVTFDGAIYATSTPRPELALGTRRVDVALQNDALAGANLVPLPAPTVQAIIHTLGLVIDSTNQVLETDEANTVSVRVRFCNFRPDLTAGDGVYLGRFQKFVPWTGWACLESSDLNVVFSGEFNVRAQPAWPDSE